MKQKAGCSVTIEHVCDWLRSEVDILMSVNIPSQVINQRHFSTPEEKEEHVNIVKSQNIPCILSDETDHKISGCEKFLSMSVYEERNLLKRK